MFKNCGAIQILAPRFCTLIIYTIIFFFGFAKGGGKPGYLFVHFIAKEFHFVVQSRYTQIPCGKFRCPQKITSKDTIGRVFRGKQDNRIEMREGNDSRMNLYQYWRLRHPPS